MEESTFTLWEKKAMSLRLVRLRMISMSVGSIGRRIRATMTGMYWDNRPMYERVTKGLPFSNIYALKNSNKGYSYSLSLKAEKSFDFGLDLAASYTFTQSKSLCPATSSQAASNWNNTSTYRFSNAPELGYSAYNLPHMIKASAFYRFHIANNKNFTTTIGGRQQSPTLINGISYQIGRAHV